MKKFSSIKQLMAMAMLLLACASVYAAKAPKDRIVVYPAPKGEELSQAYKVSVAGRDVPVYTAKIAANDKPDQFKGISDIKNSHKFFDTAAFAYFDMQGKATVTVTVPNAVTSVKILPTAAGITATIKGNSISFPVSEAKNLTIEINGEWVKSLHLFVNPLEVNVPKANDPNVIYFGPGIHNITHLEVGDNKTIYIAGGAVVRAIVDSAEKYTVSRNDGQRNYSPSIVLRGKNITVRGRGIIDASACPTHARNLLFVRASKNVNLEGIILRDPSTWTVPIRQSDSVMVDNIKIFGYRANSDGIDICNSRYVTVKNSFLRTMDDLIVIKADKDQGDSKHIFATKCVLWNQLAHALSIGAELRDNVDDVLFTDCDVIHDKGREWSLRIYQCDAGLISNVRFENIRIEEAHKFISLWIGKAVWSRDKEFGNIRNVSFKNITAAGSPLLVDLVGKDDEHGIKDVVFENVKVNGQPLTKDMIKQTPDVRNVTVN
jgi:polygalacturonase